MIPPPAGADASETAAAAAQLPVWETALRLLIATVGAAVIGWERERLRRPAGLRTHMLVALGSCLFTLLALDLMARRADVWPEMDPMRVVAGVIGGIGFLGAGAIINTRHSVSGLTTAAGIWVVAAIGVAAALGNYFTLALTTAFALVTLALLARVEHAIGRHDDADGDDDHTSPRREHDA